MLDATPATSIENPEFGLSDRTQSRLKALSINHLFPVQNAMLPRLLTSRYASSARIPPGDILVSAPTGSGKTLAYVLPIIEALSNRIVTRIRALVVVPTRVNNSNVLIYLNICISEYWFIL